MMPELNILMTTSSTLSDWMKQSQAHIEAALTDFLPSPQQTPTHLHEAMRYAVLDGGKRVRPLLVYAAGQLFDADYAELTRAACALEMIHAYSLVHDDMPCMDDDALRRGKPTVHVKFGEATALLVGDALQAQAFLILAQGKTAPARQLEMLRILAHSSGSLGMCGGQAIDLASVGCNLSRDQLEQMHQLKTGALLRASVLLGALCGQELNEIDQAALHRYSHSIGLAFQVVDDILDATSDSASLGKTAGKDAANNKPTYVSILGLAASQTLAENLRIEAHNALHSFTATMQNSRTQRLSQLADFIVQRSA
ncbi:Geranylgeranyl pyrophosphate synthase [Solimicrobium silvestre]|uniref:Geranylgeranyl pyrophosphate synthase n=2 Tax=Solimicrobium silvestre TaxID=2099400 RepID=A0A2S9GV16_9BURK|nr:Geranylgeranyl pyrophosphate synthase [Solimicrobium silvestre]